MGTTRELECILNDDSDQGKTIRSRYQAMIERNSAEVQSEFTKEFTKTMDAMGIVDSNVRLTGSFGIHLRGKRYILENTILHSCATLPKAPKPRATIRATSRKRKPPTQAKEVQIY